MVVRLSGAGGLRGTSVEILAGSSVTARPPKFVKEVSYENITYIMKPDHIRFAVANSQQLGA
jgi:hypothetical protein